MLFRSSIPDIIEKTLGSSNFVKEPVLEDFVESDQLARRVAKEQI